MALFVLSLCPFDISVGAGAFVIGLGQISSFLSEREKVVSIGCQVDPNTLFKQSNVSLHAGTNVHNLDSILGKF